MTDAPRQQVSFDSEPLILVDENDQQIGHMAKREAHRGHGTLHRAFSVFLFDERNRLLLQQRSAAKPLWPLYWSNSCCSHPRRGEDMNSATHRRVREELGVEAPLQYVYKFIYQADFGDVGAEHELCHVFIGQVEDPRIQVHPDEIAGWRWVEFDQVAELLDKGPEPCTPWFRMEWKALTGQWRDHLDRLLSRGVGV